MKHGWVKMPSGRWVTTVETKYGPMACHAWAGGQYEVSRAGKAIHRGSVWSGSITEAMTQAEQWAANKIETE